MSEARLSRRVALKVLGVAPIVSAVLAACTSQQKPDSCSDVSALAASDKAVRDALKYEDGSKDPTKLCRDCLQYQPSADPSQCGGCKIVKGPIHPDGTCGSWVKKA